jgi:hypothetical protein
LKLLNFLTCGALTLLQQKDQRDLLQFFRTRDVTPGGTDIVKFPADFSWRALFLGLGGAAVIAASSTYVALRLGALPWPTIFVAVVSMAASVPSEPPCGKSMWLTRECPRRACGGRRGLHPARALDG